MELRIRSAVKKSFLLILLSCVLAVQNVSAGDSAEMNAAYLIQGYDAYRSGDWTSAIFLLRKACSVSENATPETYYMLIMSQMYAGDYVAAEKDCRYFLTSFSSSELRSFVMYQQGRALHGIGKNEEAVLVLSDFCHQNPDNEMYASALFWLAECFYDDYNFETARTLYERIVIDFPEDAKAVDAEYKLDIINQREREQKLLYLLKMTSEEYLSAREAYEKQLKLYESEDLQSLRRQLRVANERIAELEAAASETLAAAKSAASVSPEEDTAVLSLKAKALQLQKLLDDKKSAVK